MVKPSKGAAIFLTFFGLMFFVSGLLAAYSFVFRTPNLPGKIVGLGIGLFFSAIGGGLLFAAVTGYRKMQQQAAIEDANPSSPWLWRKDWAAQRAESRKKNTATVAWVVCFLCNLILLPIIATALPDLVRRSDPRAFIFLGLFSIGAILFVVAVRATLRQQRFGKTYFEFYSLPFSPGHRVSGNIHLKFDVQAQHGIDLSLSCVRRTSTGSGDDRSTMQTILWQSSQNVPSGAIVPGPVGKAIPADFALPSDAYVTDRDNPSDQVLWIFNARADLPGIDYKDEFEIPVFKISTSPAVVPCASESGLEAPPSDPEATAVSPPPNPKVIITSQAGGTEFYFPAFRNPGRAMFLFFFTVIWTGAAYFLFHSRAPWLFPLVFGPTDLFLILALFHIAFGSARIRVGNGEIVSIQRILGLGFAKRFPFSNVEVILPVTSGQQSGSAPNTLYAIRLRTKNGKRFTLADEIDSRQEARWIVSQIESLAGLKLDTRVQWESQYGSPPQPMQPVFSPGNSGSPGMTGPGWPQSRQPSRNSTAYSLLVFVLFVTGTFAWQAWRWSTFKSMANSRARSKQSGNAPTKPATARLPSRPPVNAIGYTDSKRILALPAQDQAEELLERAIGHDQRALDLFEQNVESWIGHIRLTDRMKGLERRSEFSTDLRVRYVNADINLALDGWQKNEQAADMLIERARTDLHYRAAAVYFLGMLAGRGIAYEKIHPVLLGYAKHDPDPAVRQWAVEGMRYLGTNEALNELWESFTQDPSMSVRERAGCNISDCGNFTRLQRMRMAPKFLELLADDSTDSQMRSWCFMALREITGENLPNDTQAWRTWYGQRGAGKLAEFERLDWWQVRGDE